VKATRDRFLGSAFFDSSVPVGYRCVVSCNVSSSNWSDLQRGSARTEGAQIGPIIRPALHAGGSRDIYRRSDANKLTQSFPLNFGFGDDHGDAEPLLHGGERRLGRAPRLSP
jgi:hypothetical protein